ncbi:MAG: transcriptional regulator, partial [Clostridia bacterium]|nr:transcriptional regulator [Clostridia bacterium]
MDGLIMKMLNMSISASWLILAVVVVRYILRKSPKWIRLVLWGIVAFRLICPLSLESKFSLVPS